MKIKAYKALLFNKTPVTVFARCRPGFFWYRKPDGAVSTAPAHCLSATDCWPPRAMVDLSKHIKQRNVVVYDWRKIASRFLEAAA